MKLLTVSLVNSCNKSPYCSYCPMLEYGLYPLDFKFPYKHISKGTELPETAPVDRLTGKPIPDWIETQKEASRTPVNRLTNDILLSWIDEHGITAEDWVIELTGGEPVLYKEIDSLLYQLCYVRGFFVILKTNGSIPVPKMERLTVVSSWHCDRECPPEYYDIILILHDETDRHAKKIEWCKQNGVPYFIQWLDHLRAEMKMNYLNDRVNHFTESMHITSSGDITECSRINLDPLEQKPFSIFKNHAPVTRDNSKCPDCHNHIMVEMFLPNEVKEKVLKDYKERV